MKLRTDKMDKEYFLFTQYYFMLFQFEVQENWEHCTKLWHKWLKVKNHNSNFFDYQEVNLHEDMYAFLSRYRDKEVINIEASWSVRSLISSIKGIFIKES